MLLHFYFFCLFCTLLILVVSLIQKKMETVLRSLTLLALLQVICFAIWQGTLAFTILLSVILVFSLYELSEHYVTNRILLGLSSIIFFIIAINSDNQYPIELNIFSFITVSSIIYFGKPETVKNPSFLFAFSACFLIPALLFLIKLISINSGTIIAIFLLLQLNDAFGYLFGKQFGKTHLFPNISPKKTLEGYLFGGIGIILGIFLLHTYIPVLSAEPFYKNLIIFVSVMIFGNLGDLLLSSFKRKLDIKDFSNILPGHGGILDRFDNILFISPFFYILFKYHWI